MSFLSTRCFFFSISTPTRSGLKKRAHYLASGDKMLTPQQNYWHKAGITEAFACEPRNDSHDRGRTFPTRWETSPRKLSRPQENPEPSRSPTANDLQRTWICENFGAEPECQIKPKQDFVRGFIAKRTPCHIKLLQIILQGKLQHCVKKRLDNGSSCFVHHLIVNMSLSLDLHAPQKEQPHEQTKLRQWLPSARVRQTSHPTSSSKPKSEASRTNSTNKQHAGSRSRSENMRKRQCLPSQKKTPVSTTRSV